MILLDLLENADENKLFIVLDFFGNELARYDGKNSIPEELNNRPVFEVTFHELDTIATLY